MEPTLDHVIDEQLIAPAARLDRPVGSTSLAGRAAFAGPVVAGCTVAAALVMTEAAGVGLRDLDHVALRRFVVTVAVFAAMVGLDLAVSATRRRAWAWRRRWTPRRVLIVATAIVSFYVTYWAYRNLKSVVPLLRPGDVFDRRLGDVDRALLLGHDPAALLHSLLGTDLAARVLSPIYMLFFAFIPFVLSASLAWLRDLRAGLFAATALALNWLLGAAGYFLLPSLGPIYDTPRAFAALPATAVADLQDRLIGERTGFLAHPAIEGTAQSIGAFPSLHVSIFFTVALATHMLGLRREVKIVAWVLCAGTATATIYFGWHYILDDLGGMIIAVLALGIARFLTGFERTRPA